MSNLRTEGMLDRIRGKIRETWGDVTDDEVDKSKGNMEQLIGTIKMKTGETEDSIRARFDRWMRDDETSATTDR